MLHYSIPNDNDILTSQNDRLSTSQGNEVCCNAIGKTNMIRPIAEFLARLYYRGLNYSLALNAIEINFKTLLSKQSDIPSAYYPILLKLA